MASKWKLIKVVPDGTPVNIDGINIWDHEWENASEPAVRMRDPQDSDRIHYMSVYKIQIEGKVIQFAAKEFSNCIWGICARR